MLRTSLYLVISHAIIIACCISCGANKTLEHKPGTQKLYDDIIGTVIEFHKNKHGTSFIKDPQTCYIINPIIDVKEISVYFSFWNNHLLDLRKGRDNEFSLLKSNIPGLNLDTFHLKLVVSD